MRFSCSPSSLPRSSRSPEATSATPVTGSDFLPKKTLLTNVVLNARLAKEDLRETIAALKQEPGKDLLVLGSGQIVSALAQAGLLDEYWLFVAPRVLGSGRPLFQDVQERVQFKLIKTQQLRSGVVLLRYQRA